MWSDDQINGNTACDNVGELTLNSGKTFWNIYESTSIFAI